MKRRFLLLILVISIYCNAQEHTNTMAEKVLISTHNKERISYTEDGQLCVNVGQKDVEKLKSKGFVTYKDFDAKGDAKTDDIISILATHAFANFYGLAVKAENNASYYMGGKSLPVEIRTNTDFGTANFIIDDTHVENCSKPVFLVSSSLTPIKLNGITSLKRNQPKVDFALNRKSLISVTNSDVIRYIRFGPNQNNGYKQTDLFLIDKEGNVDKKSPIVWDFDQITEITALPVDEDTLTITGGHFTTIANNAKSEYKYYSRGIAIKRSNVVIDRMEHRVIGEGEQGAPYNGFIHISGCINVRVQNTILTGRKMYSTIGSAGIPVNMGSYDILINNALNVSFVNCTQFNDINDSRYWGIFASNYCKNLIYDNCTFSRFDAHMGVFDVTILNSTLGHQGINAIGSGTFTLENSTVYAKQLINLRTDYGSTWEGEVFIRNCVFVPKNDKDSRISLIQGFNSGQHDFGYECYMPRKISIENLRIDDSHLLKNEYGITIFADFNPSKTNESYIEKFPYTVTKEIFMKNVSCSSNKKLRISDNAFMFRDVRIINE